MVYIYKKERGGKTYYYLRASKRKGSKVLSKDIAYLGDNANSAKKALEKLLAYKDEIRKSYRKINLLLDSNRYLEKVKKQKMKKDEILGDLLFDVEACKLHYQNEFKKLDGLTQKQIMDNFVIRIN